MLLCHVLAGLAAVLPLPVGAQAVPPLEILPWDQQTLSVEWPETFPGWMLEEASNPSEPPNGAWKQASPPRLEAGRLQTLVSPAEGSARFFRLRNLDASPLLLAPIGNKTALLGRTLVLNLQATGGTTGPYTWFAQPLPGAATFDPDQGQFRFRPDITQVGDLEVVFTVSDGVQAAAESIRIEVPAAVPGAATSVSGILLDTTSATQGNAVPVVGGLVSLIGQPATALSGVDGRFVLTNITGGQQVFDINVMTAQPAPDGAPYAGFREALAIIKGVDNIMDRPFYMPRIAANSLTTVNPAVTTTVRNDALGAVVVVPPNTAKMGAENFTNQLSISLVPESLAPAALPDTLGFGNGLVTIQPVGVTFAQPVPLTLPNLDNLPAGAEMDLWSLDAQSGQFAIVGVGRVSADRRRIETISGGVRAADWHGFLPPRPSGNANNQTNQHTDRDPCAGGASSIFLRDGNLQTDFSLPPVFSLSEPRDLRWVYNSTRAHPYALTPYTATVVQRAAIPSSLSGEVNVRGNSSTRGYFNTMGFADARDETLRGSTVIHAERLPTGVHPYELRLTSHYATTSVATSIPGSFIVVNEQASPFGAGWGLAGLQRLHQQADGRVLLADGDGSASVFDPPQPGLVQSDRLPIFSETGNFAARASMAILADRRVAVLRSDRLFFVNLSGGIELDLTLTSGPNGLNTLWSLGALADGGLVVTGADAAKGGILFRIFNADGTERTAQPVLVSPVSGFDGSSQGGSSVKGLPDGSFVVLWNSTLNFVNGLPLGTHPGHGNLIPAPDTGTAIDVLGRFYDARGTPIPSAWSPVGDAANLTMGEVAYDGAVINSRYGDQRLTDFDVLPDATLLLSYRGTRWRGTSQFWTPQNYALFKGIQRNGFTFLETPMRQGVTAFETRSDLGAYTAMLSDGRLACIYDQPGNPFPLKMRLFQTDGVPVNNGPAGGQEFDLGIGLSNSSVTYFRPHAAPEGGFIMIYSKDDAGFTADMFLRRYNRDAQVVGTLPIAVGTGHDILYGSEQGRPGEWYIMSFNTARLHLQIQRYFENRGGVNAFVSPRGDASILRPAAGGGFTRTFPSGARDEFNASGLHTFAFNSSGQPTQYEYDGSGRLIKVTDPVGRAHHLTYAGGRVARVTDAVGRATTFTYDTAGNLVRTTFPDATTRQFGYDSRHLMTNETDATGLRKTRKFDADGIFQSALLADGSSISVSPSDLRGADGGPAASPAPVTRNEDVFAVIEDGAGKQRRVQTGNPGTSLLAIEPSGEVTQTTTDQDGNVNRVTYASGHQITAGYDEKGNLTTVSDSGIDSFYRYRYSEDLSRLMEAVDSDSQVIRFQRDARGHPTSITSPLGRAAQFTFNAAGLMLSATTPQGTVHSLDFDAVGNQISHTEGSGPAQRVTTAGYTPAGYLQRFTNALGGHATLAYDLVGNVTRQTLSSGQVSEFGYDANGRLVSVTPPGRPAHVLAYQAQGYLTRYTAPPIGLQNSTTSYSYNLAQQLTGVNRPDGTRISLVYDSGGRPSRTILGRGQNQFSFLPVTGQLATLISADGVTTHFKYNGELLTEILWEGAVTGSVQLAYDRNARVSSVGVNGNTINHLYDADQALIQSGAQTFNYGATTGLPAGAQLGQVQTAWEYNEFAEITRTTVTVRAAPFFSSEYERDKLGRITRRTETKQGVITVYDYTYDSSEQLDGVIRNGTETTTYTYDANGNRLSRTSPGATESGTYDAQDRIMAYAGATYTYTAAGELATCSEGGQTTHFSYDELGNLLTVIKPDGTRIDYLIDAMINRMAKKVNGVIARKFLWQSPLRVAAELDAAGQIVTRMVYGTRANVPEYIIKGGVIYRFVTDHLGSVRFVINSADGTVAQALDYDEFGRVLLDTSPGFQPFGFAGGLYDPDTGLVRFGLRDYDARAGRWTTKDPILFAGGELALYSYAANDPANLFDTLGTSPSGRDARHAPRRAAPRARQPAPGPKPVAVLIGDGRVLRGGLAESRKGNTTWVNATGRTPLYVGDLASGGEIEYTSGWHEFFSGNPLQVIGPRQNRPLNSGRHPHDAEPYLIP